MALFALAVLALLTLLRLRIFYPSAEYIETCGMIGVVFGYRRLNAHCPVYSTLAPVLDTQDLNEAGRRMSRSH